MPLFKIIFDKSLKTGKLPDDYVEANISHIFDTLQQII